MSIRDEINELLDTIRDPEATEADIDSAHDRILELIDVIEERISEILDEATQTRDSLERLFREL